MGKLPWPAAQIVSLLGVLGCSYPELSQAIADDANDGQVLDGTVSDATSQGFLSCSGLVDACGVSGTTSCCSSLVVPAGTYFRSFDRAGDSFSGNANSPATVSDFRLDKNKVTVGRFRKFVLAGLGTQTNPPPAGAGAHAKIPGSGWDSSWDSALSANIAVLKVALKCNHSFQTWTDDVGANEGRPINCVTWYEAMAFCAWDGGYLPTEAEWNYAAAGGSEQRTYPWSSPNAASLAIDSAHASYFDGTDCVGDSLPGCAVSDLTIAGSKPAGDARWGHSDLAGDVYEWTMDWHDATYENPCVDCMNRTPSTMRVVRGGSFNADVSILRTATRNTNAPSGRAREIGLRCARAP